MKIWDNLIDDVGKLIPAGVECEIKMINSTESLTRFANSHIHQNVEEELTDIFLTFHADGKTTNLNLNITSMGSIEDMVKNPTYTGITPNFWGSMDMLAGEDEWIFWGTPNCGKGQPSQIGHTGHPASPARFKNVRIGVRG